MTFQPILTPLMVPTPTLGHMVSMVVFTPPPSSALSTTDTSLPSVRQRLIPPWSTAMLSPLTLLLPTLTAMLPHHLSELSHMSTLLPPMLSPLLPPTLSPLLPATLSPATTTPTTILLCPTVSMAQNMLPRMVQFSMLSSVRLRLTLL